MFFPWDNKAVDATTEVKKQLMAKGTPIGNNDTAIAGHAIATDCVLVTNKITPANFHELTGSILKIGLRFDEIE